MAYTVSTIRTMLVAAAVNVNDDEYPDTEKDLALRAALNKVAKTLRCTITRASLTIAADAKFLNLASDIDPDITPGRLLAIELDDDDLPPPMQKRSYYDVLTRLRTASAKGRPWMFGMDTPSRTAIFPQADAEYTGTVKWEAPLVSWALGGTDGGTTSTQINLPDDIIEQAIYTFGAAMIEHRDPEMRYGSVAWQRGEQWLREEKGRWRGLVVRDRDPYPDNTYERPNF